MNTFLGDPKKEDFRKYLERNGIIDALTKVLVGLYEEPEKPDSPIEYIKHFLGGPAEVDAEALKRENEELKSRIEEMQAKIDQLLSGVTYKFLTTQTSGDAITANPDASTA